MKWFQSRTLWTLAFLFVFNGWNAIAGAFDPQIALIINTILTALAGWFRIDVRVR